MRLEQVYDRTLSAYDDHNPEKVHERVSYSISSIGPWYKLLHWSLVYARGRRPHGLSHTLACSHTNTRAMYVRTFDTKTTAKCLQKAHTQSHTVQTQTRKHTQKGKFILLVVVAVLANTTTTTIGAAAAAAAA